MANPQIEDGYTKIANEIIDALVACDLSGQDFKITLLIIRKTYGFHKLEDAISLTQMMSATGMCKVRCSQVVNRLQLMKILTVTENINGIGKKYKFNKDFEEWNTVNEKCNRYKKTKSTVNEKRNRPLMKTLTTKETITKETITKEKEKEIFTLPEWIPETTWKEYLKTRKKKKAASTPYALSLVISELQKIKEIHNHDPVAVLNKSIKSGWIDVYPLKQDGGNNGNTYGANKYGNKYGTRYDSKANYKAIRDREEDEAAARINARYEEAQRQKKALEAATNSNSEEVPETDYSGGVG
jgi:phage replication O-like protein O